MKFTTFKNTPLMGKVYNDDKTKCYGMYGQVGTLLEKGILYDIDVGREMWIFLIADNEGNIKEYGECVPQPSKEALKGFFKLRLIEKGEDS